MAIEDYYSVTYAAGTTGAQTMLEVNRRHVISVAITIGSTTADIDFQYQLTNGGTRYIQTENITQATAVSLINLTNPVTAIGLDITTNTGGTGITIEVRTAPRGS